MKKYALIISLCLIVLLTNCQTKQNYNKYISKSNGFQVEYNNLNDGDEVTIKYKIKNSTKTDDYFLRAYISSDDLKSYYTLIVKFTEYNGSLLSADFHIPNSTSSILFKLFQGRNPINEYIVLPVFTNGKPKKFSLFECMRRAGSLERFEELYSLDKQYYPNSYLREIINIETMVRGHSDIKLINEYLDKLENEYKANDKYMNLEDKFVYHSIMAYIYTQFDDSLKSYNNLKNIKKIAGINPKHELDKITLNYLNSTLNLIIKNSEHDSLFFIKYNSHKNLILQLSLYANDISFFRNLLFKINGNLYNNHKQLYDTILIKINKMIPDLSYKKSYKLLNSTDIFYTFYTANYLAQNYNACIMVLMKGIEIFEESRAKEYKRNQYYEDLNYENGILSIMKNDLAKIYLKNKDTSKAITVYKNLLSEKEINIYNRGPVIFAARGLTNIAIQNMNYEDSKKYLFAAHSLNDTRLKELSVAFEKKFGKEKSRFIQEIILSDSKRNLAVDNDIKIINTTKGVININKMPEKYFFVITVNDECVACNLSLDSFINDILHKKENMYQIILISKKKINLPDEFKNNKRILFSKETEIAKRYNAENLYPHMIVIYQNQIIFSLNTFPKTLEDLLISNLN